MFSTHSVPSCSAYSQFPNSVYYIQHSQHSPDPVFQALPCEPPSPFPPYFSCSAHTAFPVLIAFPVLPEFQALQTSESSHSPPSLCLPYSLPSPHSAFPALLVFSTFPLITILLEFIPVFTVLLTFTPLFEFTTLSIPHIQYTQCSPAFTTLRSPVFTTNNVPPSSLRSAFPTLPAFQVLLSFSTLRALRIL